MKLKTRFTQVEVTLGRDNGIPRLVIMLEDEDGNWHDGQGGVIDPVTVTPPTRVIHLTLRPDGLQ